MIARHRRRVALASALVLRLGGGNVIARRDKKACHPNPVKEISFAHE